MARSDRLLRLLHAMRILPAPITAARLAEETGVSLRSLYRDIEALRAAGACIEGERGYGYRLTEDPSLPPQLLDEGEIDALTLGMAEVQAMGDPALSAAARSVLAKIAASLPSRREQQLVHAISQVFRPAPRYDDGVDLSAIRLACWREEAVTIRYRDADGSTTERTTLPLALVYHERVITVLAWCCLREDFRMFRHDRLLSVAASSTSFRPRRVALLRDYLATLQTRGARQAATPSKGP